MIRIPSLLNADAVAQINDLLAAASWTDGNETAGHMSAKVKRNEQIGEDDPVGHAAAAIVLEALAANALFASSALPEKISPPLFNRYQNGGSYGLHIDGAIRPLGAHRMRTDLSATLFLTPQSEYDGGELEIFDMGGASAVKLNAGDLILYPSGSVHQVTPVIRGARVASFFWVQSLVPSAECRAMLLQLDTAIQAIPAEEAWDSHRLSLTALYHNLIRKWAQTG